ncbi:MULTISPECIES: hypothetical protein [unclassified Micromonospora]|uniref:hypothetical protein n=1 Tax=unclassified Micromonospora TaxID=2617518 RepID=UPI00248FD27C|nr:hypothetical protein [Micromonospora sp. AKA38]
MEATLRRTTGATAAAPTTHLVHCASGTPPTAPVGRPAATGAGRRPGSRRW